MPREVTGRSHPIISTCGKRKAPSCNPEHFKKAGEAAAKTADCDAYRRTVTAMFSDGVVDTGRLRVLKMYTDCVCAKLSPEEENRTMAHYRSWMDYIEIIEPVLARRWKVVNC